MIQLPNTIPLVGAFAAESRPQSPPKLTARLQASPDLQIQPPVALAIESVKGPNASILELAARLSPGMLKFPKDGKALLTLTSSFENSEPFIELLQSLKQKGAAISLLLKAEEWTFAFLSTLKLVFQILENQIKGVDLTGSKREVQGLFQDLKDFPIKHLTLQETNLADTHCDLVIEMFSGLESADVRNTRVTYKGIIALSESPSLKQVKYSPQTYDIYLKTASLETLRCLLFLRHRGMPYEHADLIVRRFLELSGRKIAVEELTRLIEWSFQHELYESLGDLLQFWDELPAYSYQIESFQFFTISIQLASFALSPELPDKLHSQLQFLLPKIEKRFFCHLNLAMQGEIKWDGIHAWQGWRLLEKYQARIIPTGPLDDRALQELKKLKSSCQKLNLAEALPVLKPPPSQNLRKSTILSRRSGDSLPSLSPHQLRKSQPLPHFQIQGNLSIRPLQIPKKASQEEPDPGFFEKRIQGKDFPAPTDFEVFLERASRLKSIIIEECPWFTDHHLVMIRDQCPELKKLVVRRCKEVTHVGRLLCLYHEKGSIEFETDHLAHLGDPVKLTSQQQFKELLDAARLKPELAKMLDFIVQQMILEPIQIAPLLEYALDHSLLPLLARCVEALNAEYATIVLIKLDPTGKQDQLIFFPVDSNINSAKKESLKNQPLLLNPLKESVKVLFEKRESFAVALDPDAFLKDANPFLNMVVFQLSRELRGKITSLSLRSPDYRSASVQELGSPIEDICSYIHSCPGLIQLSLDAVPLSPSLVMSIYTALSHTNKIQFLKLWNCTGIQSGHLCQMSAYLPTLRTLILSEPAGMKETDRIGNDQVYYLMRYLLNLEHFELHACMDITDEAFSRRLPQASKLRTVALNCISLEGDQPLSALVQVKNLEINFCLKLKNRIFSTLAALPSLEVLSLRHNPNLKKIAPPSPPKKTLSSLQTENPKQPQPFANRKQSAPEEPVKPLGKSEEYLEAFSFPNLTSLDLSGSPLSEGDLQTLAKSCPALQRLDLSQLDIREEIVDMLLSKMATLRGIAAENCLHLSPFVRDLISPDKPLPADLKIKNEAGVLQRQRIEWLTLRYERVRNLNPKAAKVESLEIRDYFLSPDHFQMLAGIADEAKSLTLIRSINDDRLSLCLKLFPKLESLHLESDNLFITDESLEKWRESKILKRLKLKNAFDITDKGLALIAAKFPQLKELYLENFKSVTLFGLKSLVESCRHLVRLRVDDPAALLLVIQETKLKANLELIEFLGCDSKTLIATQTCP